MIKKYGKRLLLSILGILFLTEPGVAGLIFEHSLPIRTITIDGNPEDWNGIQPVVSDIQFDTLCGEGTDFKDLYLSRDNLYLYWRLDTHSGLFAMGTPASGKGPMIHFSDDKPSFSTAVKWQKISAESEGRLLKRIYIVAEDRFEYTLVGEGPEWGMIGQVAEGKIPLSTFQEFEIFGVAGWYYSADVNPCDRISTRFPAPNIKANGQDGPITVMPSSPISIDISLDPGDQAGVNAEWWIVVQWPFGMFKQYYSYVYPTGWLPGINPCIEMPLSALSSTNVLTTTLPPADYEFLFLTDDNVDGIPDGTWVDSVKVKVGTTSTTTTTTTTTTNPTTATPQP